jgi:hypothetical protein
MRALQKIDGSLINGSGPHRGVKTGNRFHIVIQDIRPGLENSFERPEIPEEVRNQNLHPGLRTLVSDSSYGFGEDGCAPIRQIIPRHRGHHGIAELHLFNGFRDSQRLPRIRRFCGTVGHGAETAVARAAVAQNQESRCALGKAFTQIRTAGLLTHGVKMGLLDEPSYFLVRRTARYSPLEPRRLGELLLVIILLIHGVHCSLSNAGLGS